MFICIFGNNFIEIIHILLVILKFFLIFHEELFQEQNYINPFQLN